MFHKIALDYIKSRLVYDLIDGIDPTDDSQVGVVKIGPLAGEPDPDIARISVEVYANDPDQEIKGSGISQTDKPWKDEIEETEIGGGIVWRRRFTVKVRVLLENTREDLENAHRIASTVRSRVETSILRMGFLAVGDESEWVILGAMSDVIQSEMIQAGGPPDAYDFFIKVRFEILTEQFVQQE